MSEQPGPVVRLLKVAIQPVFVVIDGDDVREIEVATMTATAAEWRSLDPTTWADLGASKVAQQIAAVADNETNQGEGT
ncbi:hypothetical protein FB382_004335 [Nocardioides ginsengisegetis]|uniref:Uncharacterized protein n=1 Tax=Nocardioides ginsengisegetis TaxID=661491 RepID=A0A7W3J471_9ACTN|nr:hypothetical protein [Nocardioides ginsengisegetis]MBA8805990.1 hypothetical protein [Nocardioides ginsengisegetis]